ncbi:cutinase [Cyathus striatus]|nr:cutinase [Cyathus striatus]
MHLTPKSLLSLALAIVSVAASLNRMERQSCSDVYVYYVRGTLEAPPIGNTLGPPFQAALQSALVASGKSMVFEGVAYAASVPGYLLGGDPEGGATMAHSVTSIASECPDAKIVMSGYSQGAQVTHIAAKQLSAAVQDRVNAVVTFGDPDRDTALPGVLQSRRDTYCNTGDMVCDGVPIILPPHTQYEPDIPSAAAFIYSRI